LEGREGQQRRRAARSKRRRKEKRREEGQESLKGQEGQQSRRATRSKKEEEGREIATKMSHTSDHIFLCRTRSSGRLHTQIRIYLPIVNKYFQKIPLKIWNDDDFSGTLLQNARL
jgi:hypothetical protein